MHEDYRDTLNLPATKFPMRANLTQKEPEIKEKWDKQGLYEGIMNANEGKPLFVMHDGPPYANGDMHIGHALNKCLKDFIIKSRNMGGYKAPYIHGWDTHGLPIENQMIKKHGIVGSDVSTLEFRKRCEQFARENVERQKGQQQRLGVIGDWDNSYLTLMPRFEANQIRVFGQMAQKGYIYKGLKPVYWCPHDETALAEAEIEYSEDECDSIYVKFNVTDDKGLFTPYTKSLDNVYFVIWTTTTWTLPGNVAICLNAEFSYTLYKTGNEYIVLATELAEAVQKAAGISELDEVISFKGQQLERIKTAHPFLERESLVILGDHVTLESGTGCVHTAPGHGVEDFMVCKNYPELPIVVPVDEKGRMNSFAGRFAGQKTSEANKTILEQLKASGNLLATENLVHQYPHCWRCKSPILFRATEQWFCSVDGFKEQALDAIKSVKWIPSWGESRIGNMVKDRSDWCISRQRKWGVPIPIFYCEECKEPIINNVTIERIANLFDKEGSGAWYKYTPEEIVGSAAVCPKCGSHRLRAEQDIMDVWFDSGSSYAYVLDEMPDHRFPADVYLEGNDQYRGWFQSSLLTSVATRGVAPYRTVITHGMAVDGEGRKQSKSLGNVVDPQQIIKTHGADVLRLWVSSVEYTSDLRISPEILKQLSEIYRKVRNTIRILLANLGSPDTDFNPAVDMLPLDQLFDIDKWAVTRLNRMVGRVRKAYDNYQFHMIYHDIHNFCSIDLSKQYIDIIKDRLYCEKKKDEKRRSAQTAMYLIANSLIRLLAPILSFTAEESWSFISHVEGENTDSVFYNEMPEYDEKLNFTDEEKKYNSLFLYRDDVMKALEIARADKAIGKSLEAKITIYGEKDSDIMRMFEQNKQLLETIFIVSQVELSYEKPKGDVFSETESGISVAVSQADGEKCVRCWMYKQDTEADLHGQQICQRCKKAIC